MSGCVGFVPRPASLPPLLTTLKEEDCAALRPWCPPPLCPASLGAMLHPFRAWVLRRGGAGDQGCRRGSSSIRAGACVWRVDVARWSAGQASRRPLRLLLPGATPEAVRFWLPARRVDFRFPCAEAPRVARSR